MNGTWLVTMALVSGCASFPDELVRDMPTNDCVETCGENAVCQDNACVCAEGFYGDPLVYCEPVQSHEEWIGSPCINDNDCPYEDGFCLTANEGYPSGHCSQWCDVYCPDLDEMPITFCIAPIDDDEGHCFSRCDAEHYPHTEGCRPGYTCLPWPRANTTEEIPTCVPLDWASSQP